MHLAGLAGVLLVMRPLLASALFALGCSFALVALHGGQSVTASVILITACSTGAAMIRLLGPRQLIDDLDDTGDIAGHR